MIKPEDKKKIKKTIEDFFQKMTIPVTIKVEDLKQNQDQERATVRVDIKTEEPQILIGEKGQTLIELQRLLGMILNKKSKNRFYLDLDINDYKKKKNKYLKELAQDLADEVSLTQKEKTLSPMNSYERRIVHLALSGREDVTTESEGEEPKRKVVIKPK